MIGDLASELDWIDPSGTFVTFVEKELQASSPSLDILLPSASEIAKFYVAMEELPLPAPDFLPV